MTGEEAHILGLKPSDVALLKTVAQEAADSTVRLWLTKMGLDPDEPINSQAAFAMLRRQANDPEFAADLEWLRRRRLMAHGIIGKTIATIVSMGVMGGVWTLYAGIKTKFGLFP